MITNVTNEFDIDLGEMYRVEGREDIKPYLDRVWNILQESYAYIGGFKTYHDKKSLKNGYSFAFLYFNDDKQLCACAIYSNHKINGNKLVGAGACRTSPPGILAIHSIIRHDIKNAGANYWVECSGKIEELCKHYNGYPVPNNYVDELFPAGAIVSYNEDNFHYSRMINGLNQPVEKCIFGFDSRDFYNKIISEMGELYEKFRKVINNLFESITDELYIRPEIVKKAVYIYKEIWKLHYISGYNELTTDLYVLLTHVVKIIKRYKIFTEDIGDPTILLNEITMLKLHKFNF